MIAANVALITVVEGIQNPSYCGQNNRRGRFYKTSGIIIIHIEP